MVGLLGGIVPTSQAIALATSGASYSLWRACQVPVSEPLHASLGIIHHEGRSMFAIRTRTFELAVESGGVYLRFGQRNWYWSRETGLTR